MKLKIKSAIISHNDNLKEDEPKMTQKSLGAIVLPDESTKTQNYYMSQWANGKKVIKPGQIVRLCLATNVDPNFLFGWDKIINNENQLK